MTESTPPPPDPATAARLLEQGLSAEPAEGTDRRSPLPPPEAIQPHFPDLEIEAVIGHGGMGVVYRARQKRLDRLVALKILPEALSADPAFAERFGREARALARLDHPHIVRVYESGQSDGLYYLLMEYVDGASLRDVLHEGRMRPEEALGIVPQICEALQFAHDAGVIHRDVKPENILIDSRGRAKITDFGLAKLHQEGVRDVTLTGTGQVMGTMQYMAPEQYRTPGEVDHRADIFSLGVVFYEMLTGDLPVGRVRPPSHGQDLDRRIDEIVLKALERERDLRYQRVHEVSSAVHGLHHSPPLPTRDAAAPPAGWARLILAALAIPLGLLVFALLHEAWGGVVRGSDGAFLREILKGLGAALVFGVGTVLALQVVLRARRAGGEAGFVRTATALAILNALLVPAAMVAAAVEIRRHAVPDVPREHDWGHAALLPQVGAIPAAAERLVERLGAAWKLSPGGLDPAEAGRFYDAATEAKILAMPDAKRTWARKEARLGLPLLDPATLEGPFAEFGISQISRIRGGPDGNTATVTLSRRGGGFFTYVKFPIRFGTREATTAGGGVTSGSRAWYFDAGPVEVGHLDRPEDE